MNRADFINVRAATKEGTPVVGVLVEVIDGDGRVITDALTNPAGAVRLPCRRPGLHLAVHRRLRHGPRNTSVLAERGSHGVHHHAAYSHHQLPTKGLRMTTTNLYLTFETPYNPAEAGLTVEAWPASLFAHSPVGNPSAYPPAPSPTATTTTDSSGNCELTGLTAGTDYYVEHHRRQQQAMVPVLSRCVSREPEYQPAALVDQPRSLGCRADHRLHALSPRCSHRAARHHHRNACPMGHRNGRERHHTRTQPLHERRGRACGRILQRECARRFSSGSGEVRGWRPAHCLAVLWCDLPVVHDRGAPYRCDQVLGRGDRHVHRWGVHGAGDSHHGCRDHGHRSGRVPYDYPGNSQYCARLVNTPAVTTQSRHPRYTGLVMVTTMIVVPVLVYVAVLAAIGAVVFAGSAIVVGIARLFGG